MPGSNCRYSCGCDYCQRGKIKANSIREKYSSELKEKPLVYAEILSKVKAATSESEVERLLWIVKNKRRSSDPNDLMFLLDRNSTLIDQELALTFKKYKHKNTRLILQKLLGKSDDDTRYYAASTLLELYGQEAEKLLTDNTDLAIKNALTDWRADH